MRRSPLLRAGFAAAALLALAAPVQGADPAAVDEEAVRELLSTLEEDEARARLMENLELMLSAAPPDGDAARREADAFSAFSDLLLAFGERFRDGVRAWLGAPRAAAAVARDPGTPGRTAELLLALLPLLAAAALTWIAARLLRPARRRFEAISGEPWHMRLLAWTGRTMVELVPIAVFFASSHIALPYLGAGAPAQEAARTVAATAALLALSLALGRAAFAPRVPEIRPFPLPDGTARQAYVWLHRFAWLGLAGGGLLALLEPLAEGPGLGLLRWVHGILLAGLAAALIQRLRKPMARWISGSGGPVQQRIAGTWHVFAALYVAALAAAWLLGIADGGDLVVRGVLAVAVVLAVAALAKAGASLALRTLVRLQPEAAGRPPGSEAAAGPPLAALRIVSGALIWLIAAVALLQVWGLGELRWIGSEGGRTALAGVVRVLVFAVGILVLVEVVHSALSGALARISSGRSPGGAPRRLRTLLPLAATTMRIAALAVVVLIALSEFGVNIGPLLAGAGVLGIAIGFGAQKLVQDVITGLFILIEDSVAIGDVVQAAGHSGTVESLSLRAMTLRDLAGNVHTIPFSNVETLENMTKGFSYAVLDVGVAYREDTDEVVQALEGIAAGLREDPGFSGDILAPLEVLGVQELGDSAVVIRIRMRTAPGSQWRVRRELNRRVKRGFDERGIEIPFPHRTVLLEGGQEKGGG